MTSTWPKTEVLSVTPPSPPAVATWRSKPSPTEPNQTVCSYVAVTVGVMRESPLSCSSNVGPPFTASVMVGVTCQLAPTFGVCVVTLSSCSMSK